MLIKTIYCISNLLIWCQGHVLNTSPGYSYAETNDQLFPDWMSDIPDNSRLCDLSIPGTHETLSKTIDLIFRCQSKSLITLLESGIRMIDVRVGIKDEKFVVHHEYHYFGDFDDYLDIMINYLDEHPTETILMRLFDEGDDEGDAGKMFSQYYQTYNGYIFSSNKQAEDITLGETRGKIVIFVQNINVEQDQTTMDIYQYSKIFIDDQNTQDDWKFSNNWYLYTKWEKVRDFIKNSHYGWGFRLNYLSGSFGAFPYFVSSGKSFPLTNSPRLSTGIPSCSSDYPEFPRYFGFIYFEGTNIMTYQYLRDNNPYFTGIIMADFPGSGLIEEIIKCNYRVFDNDNSHNGNITEITTTSNFTYDSTDIIF